MRTLCLCLLPTLLAAPARVKDVASIEGVRDNQLLGYGLVVGLNGTGDKRQTFFSAQTLANLLDRMGVQVSANAMLVRNTAAVMITATLPPFAQPGTRLDVTAAAIGDCTNLQGGLLVLTPLKSADGTVFAVAQGSVVTGGFGAGRGGGNSTVINHPTAGRVPAGAIVERAAPSVIPAGPLRLQLRQADFTTAARLSEAINKRLGPGAAVAQSSGLVLVQPPASPDLMVARIAEIESLAIESDHSARIVINERTGTIAMGKDLQFRPASILHGALAVEIQTTFEVSQPNPLAKGSTAVVPQVSVSAKEERARNVTLQPGATVEDLVKALLGIGSTPRDVIAILQALRRAGGLDAEIEVI